MEECRDPEENEGGEQRDPEAAPTTDRPVFRTLDFWRKIEHDPPLSEAKKSERSVRRLSHLREKTESLDPSSMSIKSDGSIGRIIDFRGSTENLDPSRLSMKSDRSTGRDIDFRGNAEGPDRGVSMKSDCSVGRIIDFREKPWSSDDPVCPQDLSTLDHIFKRLQEDIFLFVKEQLERFHKVLASNYPDCSMSEEEEQTSKKAVLNITLDFLRRMNQEPLAERLHSRTSVGVYGDKLKMRLKQRFGCVSEGISTARNPLPLNQIYTELHIAEGVATVHNQEHEVRLIQTASRRPSETSLPCEDIFKVRPHSEKPIRTVLTKGVAGIGKTVLTQKFSLDWAEGRANQELQLLFPFTFRELNVLRDTQFSLVELLHHFFSESKGLCSFEDIHVVFVFDGLDECRLPLDFRRTRVLSDPTESVSVDVLLVNLIRGSLLPSARLWITTRPAAANQIPDDCVSMVTEVRGFTDPQKEQYFKKRFRDEQQVSAVISHIKTSPSLHFMCHLPVFCWILSTVLHHVMEIRDTEPLPQTLTHMYVHFLVVQAKVKSLKYNGSSEQEPIWSPETREMVRSLGKLAFEQLQKGNLIFYESDLRECGLDVAAASVYSGVFTQVFREEPDLYQEKIYCFIHLSVQEFLAALHVHLTFFNSGIDLLSTKHLEQSIKSKAMHKITKNIFRKNSDPQSEKQHPTFKPAVENCKPEIVFYQSAVDQALQSPNGQLDLFLRFLLGLSLEANQRLLWGLHTQKEGGSLTNQETVCYIKEKLNENVTAEQSLNLLHCLNELNDRSLVETVQRYLKEGTLTDYEVHPSDWSAVAFILLFSDSNLEEFDLRKHCPSETVLLKLLPVVKASTKAILSGCSLSPHSCGPLASILSSSCLTTLDLSNNNLQDSGVELLCSGLKSAPCRLETLRVSRCNLSYLSCGPLASVLSSHSSSLSHLDLSNNNLWNSGVELLCDGLRSALCRLHTLRLSGCLISERGGSALASALSSAHSHLRELDLSYNHPGPSAKLLTTLQDDPHCSLDSLRLTPAGKQWMVPSLWKYFCEVSLERHAAHRTLRLSTDGRRVTCVAQSHPGPRFDDVPRVVSSTALSGRCYWELDWEVDSEMGWNGAVELSLSCTGHIKGRTSEQNGQSWSLRCCNGNYSVHHNNRDTFLSVCPNCSGRVGVFLDSEAGSLSFYEVLSGGELRHLHTFSSTFTQPLFPGFTLGPGSSVSLVKAGIALVHNPAQPPLPPLPLPPPLPQRRPTHTADTGRLKKK